MQRGLMAATGAKLCKGCAPFICAMALPLSRALARLRLAFRPGRQTLQPPEGAGVRKAREAMFTPG